MSVSSSSASSQRCDPVATVAWAGRPARSGTPVTESSQVRWIPWRMHAIDALTFGRRQVTSPATPVRLPGSPQAGFPLTPLDEADAVWAQRRAHSPAIDTLVDRVFACPGHPADIDRVFAGLRPELVVAYCLDGRPAIAGSALPSGYACQEAARRRGHRDRPPDPARRARPRR